MRKLLIRASMLSAVVALSLPAMAGNYAEGDPRPVARGSAVPSAAVGAETRAWMATAPTVGYPEGDPRAAMASGGFSREAVQADTLIWMRSGLAGYANGERGMDPSQPGFRQAARSYAQMRQPNVEGVAQMPAHGVTPR
jgi:hypothetical protein